jgi:nucleoside-diphosphate-sugar epimerase
VLAPGPLEGVALRYGFFYGRGMWYSPEGVCADQARRQELPIVGKGEGVWSWVHIVDVAHATVAALTAPPSVYIVVDDEPLPGQRLPTGVRQERRCPTAPTDHGGAGLRGASNAKAKKALRLAPRRLEWLAG